jgi:predicted aldo/keto reductase-like oxidoreductase
MEELRPPRHFSRREFVQLGIAAGLFVSMEQFAGASTGSGDIPYRELGSTGEKVSIIGIGGYHIGNAKDDDEAVRIVRKALDSGVNFLDNSWDYHDGLSENRAGKALKDGYRNKAFVMTKLDSHSKEGATNQLNESLKRLGTDHVDLIQLHEVIRMDDPEKIFAKGGSIEAVMEAKKAGKARFIGFTGHKSPKIHLHMLEVAKQHGFHFDTVQMPINVLDAHFESFGHQVVPVAVEQKIGVLGMKPIADGRAIKTQKVSAPECLRFALSMPTSVVITGCESIDILDQALTVARNFKPMSKEETAKLMERTSEVAAKGEFELYKTTHNNDSTISNPQWLA